MISTLPRQRIVGALRALGIVALTSVLAPIMSSLLLWAFVAVLHPSRAIGLPELVGLTVWAVMLGAPAAILSCLVALCGVWLARRLDVASRRAFAIGGAVLALAPGGAIAVADIVDWSFRGLIDSTAMIISLAATGAISGFLWWVVLARTGGRPSREAVQPA